MAKTLKPRQPEPEEDYADLVHQAGEEAQAKKAALRESERRREPGGDVLDTARKAVALGREKAEREYAELGRLLNSRDWTRAQRRRLKASRLFLIDHFGSQIRVDMPDSRLSDEARRLRSRKHFTITKPQGPGVLVILLGQDNEPYRKWFLQGSDLWATRKPGLRGHKTPPPPPGEAPGVLNKTALTRLIHSFYRRLKKTE
jgi:hypothetical protein